MEGHDLLRVLAHAGTERDACSSTIGTEVDDVQLIRAAIGAAARFGREPVPATQLAHLAAAARILWAYNAGLIDRDELASGIGVRAAATADFDRLGTARALVRTIRDLLADPRLEAGRVDGQLGLLHSQLEQTLRDHVGSTGLAPVPSSDTWREQHRIADPGRASELDWLARTWAGRMSSPMRRAWLRSWKAVPVAGGLLGDEELELDRLAGLLGDLGSSELIQVKLRPQGQYVVRDDRVFTRPALRPSYSFSATRASIQTALSGDRGPALITATDPPFLIVEGEEHHVVVGPAAHVEQLCGCSVAEALAAFRAHAERASGDEELAGGLLEVALRFGQ